MERQAQALVRRMRVPALLVWAVELRGQAVKWQVVELLGGWQATGQLVEWQGAQAAE